MADITDTDAARDPHPEMLATFFEIRAIADGETDDAPDIADLYDAAGAVASEIANTPARTLRGAAP